MAHRSSLFRTSALAGGLLALVSALPAMAQETPVIESGAELEDIVVTGTRLRLPDYVASNPVTSVTAETLEYSGQTNVTQFLQDVPSLVNSVDIETGSDVNSNFNGLSLLDLRNLGALRTLVLVDGRRHVGSNPGTSSVDATAIPAALIERTEILTGGASAIYGADGVSGVVNFILKKDFEGVDLRSQYGWSQHGGGENIFLSALVGENFHEDRGNITFGFEYDDTKDVKFEDREFTRTGRLVTLVDNPDDVNADGSIDNPDIVDLIPVRGVHYYDTSLLGSVYTNFNTSPNASGVTFLGNGQPFVDGTVQYGSALALGGSGTPVDMFNDDLIPGQKRYTLYSTGSYELSDRHELFGELKYTNSKVDFEGQPPYDYGLFISAENPFLPANILADAQTPGGFASDPDGGPYGPGLGLPGPGVLVARDNFYLGRLQQETENETLRGVIGLRGDLTDAIRYEASYVYGRANQTIEYGNVLLADRYYAATDVVSGPTGGPVCRSDLDPTAAAPGDLFGQNPYDASYLGQGTFTPGAGSGCLPLNIFGEADPAAIDWVMGEDTYKAELTQQVFTAFVTGDTEQWFSLPAGPISFVFGGEYRKEESTTDPSSLQRLAEEIEYAGLSSLGRAVATRGSYDVSEVFTELNVPILRDLPFAQELTLNGAYRYSDYSTAGETDTWNVGFRYRPISDLMLRGTIARAVRAPNINDIFRGRSQTAAGFNDPCDRNNREDGENPTQRQANCDAALTALGIADPENWEDTSSETTLGFITGNPNLEPEVGDTQTLGLVYSPSFVSGLTVSLDYYDIEITGAIQPYTVQRIIDNCYDLPAGNEFCDLIERTPTGVNPGRISTFEQIPGNLAFRTTRGIDFGVRYNLNPADWGVTRDVGAFSLGLVGNHLLELRSQDTEEAPVIDNRGVEGAPEWQATFDATWRYNRFLVNYGISWFDRTGRFSNTTLRNHPDIAAEEWKYYEERFIQDVQVRYDLENGFELYAGVNNLGDQEPQPSGFGDASYPVSGLGRFFYIGATAKF